MYKLTWCSKQNEGQVQKEALNITKCWKQRKYDISVLEVTQLLLIYTVYTRV